MRNIVVLLLSILTLFSTGLVEWVASRTRSTLPWVFLAQVSSLLGSMTCVDLGNASSLAVTASMVSPTLRGMGE